MIRKPFPFLQERMATVLSEREIVISDFQPGNFEVRETANLGDAFDEMGLSGVFEQFVSVD